MTTTKINKKNASKFIDEMKFDTKERAKSTLEYEQMLMNFIEAELRGGFTDVE